MNIKFYTANTNNIADVAITIPAPWGEQMLRCCIVRSQMTNAPRVLWPKAGPKFFATTPASREETAKAEAMILDEFKTWQSR